MPLTGPVRQRGGDAEVVRRPTEGGAEDHDERRRGTGCERDGVRTIVEQLAPADLRACAHHGGSSRLVDCLDVAVDDAHELPGGRIRPRR